MDILAVHAVFNAPLYDIATPALPVEVQIGKGPAGATLWVNIGPQCVLRITGINQNLGAVNIERDGERV